MQGKHHPGLPHSPWSVTQPLEQAGSPASVHQQQSRPAHMFSASARPVSGTPLEAPTVHGACWQVALGQPQCIV
jgi:hypothetical protein